MARRNGPSSRRLPKIQRAALPEPRPPGAIIAVPSGPPSWAIQRLKELLKLYEAASPAARQEVLDRLPAHDTRPVEIGDWNKAISEVLEF